MSVATAIIQLTHNKLAANRFTVIDASDAGLQDVKQLFMVEASGDMLIIEEDKFKTGYECKTCDGDGFIDSPCPMCVGRNRPKGWEESPEVGEPTRCRLCHKERGSFGMYVGAGLATCDTCGGKGTWIVIPQTSERRPTSGVIRSMGPSVSHCVHCVEKVRLDSGDVIYRTKIVKVPPPDEEEFKMLGWTSGDMDCVACNNTRKTFQVGNRVLYTVFSGTAVHFKQKGVVRFLHENEVICRIFGLANLGEIVK